MLLTKKKLCCSLCAIRWFYLPTLPPYLPTHGKLTPSALRSNNSFTLLRNFITQTNSPRRRSPVAVGTGVGWAGFDESPVGALGPEPGQDPVAGGAKGPTGPPERSPQGGATWVWFTGNDTYTYTYTYTELNCVRTWFLQIPTSLIPSLPPSFLISSFHFFIDLPFQLL